MLDRVLEILSAEFEAIAKILVEGYITPENYEKVHGYLMNTMDTVIAKSDSAALQALKHELETARETFVESESIDTDEYLRIIEPMQQTIMNLVRSEEKPDG